MKIVFKSKLSQLPSANIPQGWCKLQELSSVRVLTTGYLLFPLVLLTFLAFFLKGILHDITVSELYAQTAVPIVSLPTAILLLVAFCFIHEYIHVCLYPRQSTVYIVPILSRLSISVICQKTMTRNRFLLVCIMPIVVLGVLPLILWLFIPPILVFLNSFFFYFYLVGLFGGVGDLLAVWYIMKIPATALVQNEGFDTYYSKDIKSSLI
ncbi:MAG: DUF3267 domain-containing protein [Treponema sp.]|nr:DUF3267 domain-containing protein [Treponema sp.]